MRLDLRSNCTPIQKFQFNMIEMLIGQVPGPIEVMTYRRDFWGKPMTDCFDEAMRKMTAWTKPEVELIAATVSRANTCNFCYTSHKAVTVLGFDDELVEAALNDPQTAPVSEKLRAALVYADKLTRTPDDITKADINALYDAGLNETAITEVTYISFCFSVINRFANTFDFDLGQGDETKRTARFLYHMGYSTGSLPG